MSADGPTSRWGFPDLRDPAVENGADELVAFGADLEPQTLLDAYRAGLFPMPGPRHRGSGREIGWWSPTERGVLPLDGLRVSRSLRQSSAHYEIRVDTAFAEVVAACGDPRRPDGWIDERIAAAYSRMHALGHAHSVEAWAGGVLVGGLYGLAIGGLFAGESMFHHARDASKVALVALVDLLRDGADGGNGADNGPGDGAGDGADRLLDVQWATPHLSSLGVVEIPRADYLRRLDVALTLPLPSVWA